MAINIRLTPSSAQGPKKGSMTKIFNMEYYTEGDIRVPILDKKGKQRTPRAVKSLLNKNAKTALIDIVREYGGEAKVEELRGTTNGHIAQWIHEVEVQALGNVQPGQSRKRDRVEDGMTDSPLKSKKPKHDHHKVTSPDQANYLHTRPSEPAEEPNDFDLALLRGIEDQPSKSQSSSSNALKNERALTEACIDDFAPPDGFEDEYDIIDVDEFGGASCAPGVSEVNYRIAIGDPLPREIIPKFMKPGKHGFNYETGKWYWEGDPDLYTGRGHQESFDDLERLEREGDTYRDEFERKYYWGKLGTQWPCGCMYPWSESDSEEE